MVWQNWQVLVYYQCAWWWWWEWDPWWPYHCFWVAGGCSWCWFVFALGFVSNGVSGCEWGVLPHVARQDLIARGLVWQSPLDIVLPSILSIFLGLPTCAQRWCVSWICVCGWWIGHVVFAIADILLLFLQCSSTLAVVSPGKLVNQPFSTAWRREPIGDAPEFTWQCFIDAGTNLMVMLFTWVACLTGLCLAEICMTWCCEHEYPLWRVLFLCLACIGLEVHHKWECQVLLVCVVGLLAFSLQKRTTRSPLHSSLTDSKVWSSHCTHQLAH